MSTMRASGACEGRTAPRAGRQSTEQICATHLARAAAKPMRASSLAIKQGPHGDDGASARSKCCYAATDSRYGERVALPHPDA